MPESSARRTLADLAQRASERPDIAGAVVGYRVGGYFWHRTRFMAPRVLLRTVLHALELYLLSSAVPWDTMGPYFLMRGITLLVGGVHWGWLEGFRERVRSLYRERRFADARASARAWLQMSGIWGVVALLAAVGWMAANVDGYDGFSVFDAFALACAARITLEALARTYHALLYSVRRVHRPLSSLLVPDAVEPIGLLVLFPTWGLWSFSMVALLGGCVRAYLTYAWSRKSIEITPLAGPLRSRRRASSSEGYLRALLPGLASLSAQVDALILVALATTQGSPFLAAVYLFRPLLAGVQGAFRTFYFDLKLLEQRCPAILQRGYLTRLRRLALGLGAGAGLVIAAIAWRLTGTVSGVSLIGLIAFGAVRSLFSVGQVQAFAARKYALLLVVSVFLAACLATVAFGTWSDSLLFGGLVGVLMLGAGALIWLSKPQNTDTSSFPLASLLRATFATNGPLIFFSAQVEKHSALRPHAILKEARRVLPTWTIHADGRRGFFGFAPHLSGSDDAVAIARSEFCRATAGGVGEFHAQYFTSGSACAARMRSSAPDPDCPLAPRHQEALAAARRQAPREPREVVHEMKQELRDLEVIEGAGRLEWKPGPNGSERVRALLGLSGSHRGGSVFIRVFPADIPGACVLLCPRRPENAATLERWSQILEIEALRVVLSASKRG